MHGADRTGEQAASYVVPAPARGAHHRHARLPRAADTYVVIEAVFESRGPMLYAETAGLQAILTGIEKYRVLLGSVHWEPAPLLVRPFQAQYRRLRGPRDRSFLTRGWSSSCDDFDMPSCGPGLCPRGAVRQSSRNAESIRRKS
jgi:hypothetical protein